MKMKHALFDRNWEKLGCAKILKLAIQRTLTLSLYKIESSRQFKRSHRLAAIRIKNKILFTILPLRNEEN